MKCALVLVVLALVGLAAAAPHKYKKVKQMKRMLEVLQQKQHKKQTEADLKRWGGEMLPALCHKDGLTAGFVALREGMMKHDDVPQEWKDNMPTAEEMLAEAEAKEGMTRDEYATAIKGLCAMPKDEAIKILANDLAAAIGLDRQYPGVSPLSALIAIQATLCEGPGDFMEKNLVGYLKVVEAVLNVAFAADPEGKLVSESAEKMAENLKGALALDTEAPPGTTVSQWIRHGVCSQRNPRQAMENLVGGLFMACEGHQPCTDGLSAGVAIMMHHMQEQMGPGSSGSGSWLSSSSGSWSSSSSGSWSSSGSSGHGPGSSSSGP